MLQKLERFGAILSAVGPIVGVVVLFAIAIGVPTLIGLFVLGPINRAAGRLRAPTRFQLSDFLWLLVQVQLALAYCVEFVGVKHLWFFTLVLGFLLTAVTAMWAGGVSFMSRAGVTHPPRRAVFVLFLLPMTLALMMTTTLLLVAAGFGSFTPAIAVGAVAITAGALIASKDMLFGRRSAAGDGRGATATDA